MKKTRIALIGCGNIGRFHLEHFKQMPEVELVGVCDLIIEKAEVFAKEMNCPAFKDYKEMLDAVSPEAVFIGIPPYCHGEIEFTLIERKIHMFVQKPVGLDRKLILDINDKIRESGIITASGLQLRYETTVPVLKDFASRHKIVSSSFVRIGRVPQIEWWRERSKSGGQLVEQAIHQVDMMRYVLDDEAEEVFSFGSHDIIKDMPGFDVEDMSVSAIRFKKGTLATFTVGCYATGNEPSENKMIFGATDARADYFMLERLKVYGDKVEAQAENDSAEVVKGDGRIISSGNATIYQPSGDCGLVCDKTFIKAIQTGDPGIIKSPYEDAIKSVFLTLACNESMVTGKPVKVDLDF